MPFQLSEYVQQQPIDREGYYILFIDKYATSYINGKLITGSHSALVYTACLPREYVICSCHKRIIKMYLFHDVNIF